jgi:hypothetical protein
MTYGEYAKAQAKLAKINHDLDEMWENAETEEARKECMVLEKEAEELQAIVAEGAEQYKATEDNDEDMEDDELLKTIEKIMGGSTASTMVEKEVALADSATAKALKEGATVVADEPAKKDEEAVKKARKPREKKEPEPEVTELGGFKLGQKAGWKEGGQLFEGIVTKIGKCYLGITIESGKHQKIKPCYTIAL